MIDEGLKPFLERAIDIWEMQSDGSYRHARHSDRRRRAHPQEELLNAFVGKTPNHLR